MDQWEKLYGFGDLFTRYVHSKSIKMLCLHYHELVGKIKEQKVKKIIDFW